MSLDLYELPVAYQAITELPEEEDPSDFESLHEAVAAIREEACNKALSLAKVVKCLEGEAQLIEDHVRSLQAKAQTRRNRIAFLRSLMRLELESAGRDRARDALVTVWLQQSSPAVEVVDEAAVPAEFMRAVLRLPFATVPSDLRGYLQHLDVDRAAILDQLKRTGEVPNGVSVRTGERHIRIRS